MTPVLPQLQGAIVLRWRLACLILTTTLGLMACSPTFNWRDLRPADTPLQALMPCKPESAERSLPLEGTPTVLHMSSCEAGGMTFAVAWAAIADENRSAQALEAWRAGTLATLRSQVEAQEAPPEERPLRVPGAENTLSVLATGQGPDGKGVQVRAVYFSKGKQVFQAAVYGQRLPPEAVAPFFEGLKLP